MPPALGLPAAIAGLRRHYGAPAKPVSRDPFHLILWEQVGYLFPDAQRRAAFLKLRREVGLDPMAILGASSALLETIARLGGGMAADKRAARMKECAELAVGRWDGDLGKALDLPPRDARRALREFPGIGDSAADRILAITGRSRVLPMDSNALRVVLRLGLAPALKDYGATYRRAQAALAPTLPRLSQQVVAAGALLKLHGQELCRRSTPSCDQCPLRRGCPSAGRPMKDRW